MPGQIISRGKNTWLVRVFLGRDAQTGKREYHNHTIHGTKHDAQEYLIGTLRERDLGVLSIGAEKRTIDVLLDELLRDYRINEQKSVDWAELLVTKHLRPFFGQIPLPSSPVSTSTGSSI